MKRKLTASERKSFKRVMEIRREVREQEPGRVRDECERRTGWGGCGRAVTSSVWWRYYRMYGKPP